MGRRKLYGQEFAGVGKRPNTDPGQHFTWSGRKSRWQLTGRVYFTFFKIFFFIWTVFKASIEFVTIFLFFLMFWLWGMWDFSSPTRDRTCTPFIGRWNLNHQTTREVPHTNTVKWKTLAEKVIPKMCKLWPQMLSLPFFTQSPHQLHNQTLAALWSSLPLTSRCVCLPFYWTQSYHPGM